jgi:hypothetical protein
MEKTHAAAALAALALCGSFLLAARLGKKDLGANEPPAPNVFLEGNLVFYNHIGGHITTAEETAKYYELIGKYFKVK